MAKPSMRAAEALTSPMSERGLDLYETPPAATRALLAVESLPQILWEPAAGRGAMVRVLREAGHHVFASDLVRYPSGDDFTLDATGDFLQADRAPRGCEAIVTNPPYAQSAAFVRQALTLCPRVYMLLRLQWLESDRREELIRAHLVRLWSGVDRLPMMHRDGYAGPKIEKSRLQFGWFVFDRHKPALSTIALDLIRWGAADGR